MRILIALNENKGMDSKLSEHFGHCKIFGVYDIEEKKLSFIENKLDHSNASLTPVDQIMVHKPDIVFSLGMGERAKNLFSKEGVEVKSGNFLTLKDVLDNVDSLIDLNSSCDHSC